MIRIITVEREFGAGGTVTAEKIAEHLGWKLWDQALTAEIARLAHVDPASVEHLEERCDSRFYRLMKVFMRGSFERSLPVEGLDNLDADSMVAFMQRVIDGAAAEGNCVIVGRGAPYFLRDREDVSMCSSTLRAKRKSAACGHPARARTKLWSWFPASIRSAPPLSRRISARSGRTGTSII